jgi:NitT/TauT family transport system substrate-binding protein
MKWLKIAKVISLLVFCSLLLALFLTSGCKRSKNSKAPSAPTKKLLQAKVGYLPMVTNLTHFVAEEEGFYEKYGVKVEGERINTSNLLAQEVAAGHIDVAIELAVNPLVNVLAQNPDAARVFSVSTITTDGGFDGVIVRGDSDIKSMSDLAGKKVAVFPGTTAAIFFNEVFKAECPGKTAPDFLPMSPNLHLQELETKRVDAVHAYEPYLAMGIVNKGFRQIAPSIYALNFSPSPIGVAAINSAWKKENSEAAEAILSALDDAVVFIRKNPEKARDILSRSNQIDPNVAKKMNIMPMSTRKEIDKEHLQKFLIRLKDMNEINYVPKIDELVIQ